MPASFCKRQFNVICSSYPICLKRPLPGRYKGTTHLLFPPRPFTCLIIATPRRTPDEAPTNKVSSILLFSFWAQNILLKPIQEVREIRTAIPVFVPSEIVHIFFRIEDGPKCNNSRFFTSRCDIPQLAVHLMVSLAAMCKVGLSWELNGKFSSSRP